MKKAALYCAVLLTVTSAAVRAASPVVVVTDARRASARAAAPVSLEVDIESLLAPGAARQGLQLTEVTEAAAVTSPVAAQFVPEATGAGKGTLWWLMPPGEMGQRRFRLSIARQPAAEQVLARYDSERQAVDVSDGQSPVLRYNHGTVPPPPTVVERYEKQKTPPEFYARGNYIHPVFGPHGEELTDDYSLDHPHHRGISWAWPHVRYRGESRNLWAVRVPPSEPGGVWARPVALHRLASGPVLALIEAESVWKWGDTTPIVNERVVIRAFRQTDRCRFLDVDIRLVALVDEVSIAGQKGGSYGGFNFRTYPEFERRKIDMRIDPPDAEPRRAWYHLTGNFPGGKGPAGVVLLENAANPGYPNQPEVRGSDFLADFVPGGYPRWRTVQPAWPGDRQVNLPKGQPLVLEYRLWIHPGLSDEPTLTNLWQAYAQPAEANVLE